MRRIRCIAVSAEGGFKIINGSPKMGKDPMESKEDLKSSNEASQPQPTQAGRIETCTESIRQAMKCLGNGDRECVLRKIEELIKANCHNGNAVGKEIAGKVKDLVHEMWLISNHEKMCGLLIMLRDLNISRNWVRDALGMNTKTLDKWLVRCGISWESRTTRNNVVEEIEDLLRRLGWSETWMCEELFKFIGIDVEAFRRHGIELCAWLNGLELLSDLRRPYWLGMAKSDLMVWKYDGGVRLELKTTNSIDAMFFAKLLNTVKAPSLKIKWERGAPAAKYIHKPINLLYYVDLGIDEWPWPIEPSADELRKILERFSDEELAKYVAGEIDGDGKVDYHTVEHHATIYIEISACKDCPKRINLDVLRKIIAKRFDIVSYVYSKGTADVLVFGGEDAVKLLRLIRPFVHHPLRRLRIELILALYDGRISREVFERLYNMTKYERGAPDVKRNRGLEALARAAPQTHTHGEQTIHKKELNEGAPAGI